MSKPDVRFSQAIFDTICERLSNGESLRGICRDDGMPQLSTVWRWMVDNEERRNQYMRAREEQADTLADEIVAIADNATDAQIARLQVDARKWFASKVAPKKYGDKTDITSNGNTIAVAPIAWSDE
jgi:hypothetical protein